jgi:hypothetical protein
MLVDHDIRGLDIAMDHGFLVSILQRERQVPNPLGGLPAGRTPGPHPVGQRLTLNKLQSDERLIALHGAIVDRHDIRVTQSRGRLGLAQKADGQIRLPGS